MYPFSRNCVRNWSITNYVPTGFQSCLWKNTKWNVRKVPVAFFDSVQRAKGCLPKLYCCGDQTWVHTKSKTTDDGMETRLITSKWKIQTRFLLIFVYTVLGQKTSFVCGILTSMLHNQLRRLLWSTVTLARTQQLLTIFLTNSKKVLTHGSKHRWELSVTKVYIGQYNAMKST